MATPEDCELPGGSGEPGRCRLDLPRSVGSQQLPPGKLREKRRHLPGDASRAEGDKQGIFVNEMKPAPGQVRGAKADREHEGDLRQREGTMRIDP